MLDIDGKIPSLLGQVRLPKIRASDEANSLLTRGTLCLVEVYYSIIKKELYLGWI